MVGDALVDMHAKSRSIKIKDQVFDTFSFKDVASWNAVIEGCSYNQYSDKAQNPYCKMDSSDALPDTVIVINILPICSH